MARFNLRYMPSTLRASLRPYVEYVQSGEHGFVSTTLPLSDGFEYSVYVA